MRSESFREASIAMSKLCGTVGGDKFIEKGLSHATSNRALRHSQLPTLNSQPPHRASVALTQKQNAPRKRRANTRATKMRSRSFVLTRWHGGNFLDTRPRDWTP